MVKAMFMGETNISMDDDDMNYLVKAVIKGETNISMIDDDMNYLRYKTAQKRALVSACTIALAQQLMQTSPCHVFKYLL